MASAMPIDLPPPAFLPEGREFVRADLQRFPDDGNRYELLDGALLVSPAPRRYHQRAVGRLYRLLDDACPADHEVLMAPFAVALADDTELQPDVLVAGFGDLTDQELPGAPALAVEVLSPSTRLFDLYVKRLRLEQAGAPAYWVVDPDPARPRLLAWELIDGMYQQVAEVTGKDPFTAALPYPVTVVAGDLVRDRR